MILVVDNQDSFTFNLAEALAGLGATVRVEPCAAFLGSEGLTRLLELRPAGVLVGPGPGAPGAASASERIVREVPALLPVLGVCLGHQAIGTAFGGRVVQAQELVHGETRPVLHDGRGVFAGLPSPLALARYNSLVVDERSLRAALDAGLLTITAREPDGAIAGLRHTTLPLEGIQGHPESVLCIDRGGRQLLANWLAHVAAPSR